RSLWRPGPPVHAGGRHHAVTGAQPGPAPHHPVAIWIGAYKRRMLELTGRLSAERSGFLKGPTSAWVDDLAELALRDGMSAFLLGVTPGDDSDLRTFAEEVAPRVRELVAKQRREGSAAPARRPCSRSISTCARSWRACAR